MLSDRDITNQIRSLKQIKPDKEWVTLAKYRIIGQEEVGHKQSLVSTINSFFFQYRVAFASLLMVVMAGGTIAAAQNSLPGEPLYPVKKASEKGLAMISGQNNDPAANLQLAARRLEEINQISQKNLVKNLPTAFKEYKTAKVTAKKEMAAKVMQNPSKAGEIIKEASPAMKDIDIRERQVYGVLGLDDSSTSTEDGSEAASDKVIVGSLIEYFKKDTVMTGDQKNDLEQVQTLYDTGTYGKAMEYYLNSSLNK